MNVYESIMKAADHIERHPELFRYARIDIPDCGTPGCALGWIGHFMGRVGELSECVVPQLLGLEKNWMAAASEFYERMSNFEIGWKYDALDCARALRLYAAKYHAPTKPKRPTSAMLADLMARVNGERIPEDAVS